MAKSENKRLVLFKKKSLLQESDIRNSYDMPAITGSEITLLKDFFGRKIGDSIKTSVFIALILAPILSLLTNHYQQDLIGHIIGFSLGAITGYFLHRAYISYLYFRDLESVFESELIHNPKSETVKRYDALVKSDRRGLTRLELNILKNIEEKESNKEQYD